MTGKDSLKDGGGFDAPTDEALHPALVATDAFGAGYHAGLKAGKQIPKLSILSRVGKAGKVEYYVRLEGVEHPLNTSLAYALVRNGHASFLTTEQATEELFQ